MTISNKAVKFKFPLGIRVRDLTCGFEGIIDRRTQHLNGCVVYGVVPPINKDGERVDTWNLDEDQLVKVDDGIHVKPKKKPTGGAPSRTSSVRSSR